MQAYITYAMNATDRQMDALRQLAGVVKERAMSVCT